MSLIMSFVISLLGKMLPHVADYIYVATLLFISADDTAADYIYVDCSGAHFTRLTPYETNVNSLFSSLVNSASVTNFNKFEISETNVVYGLYQCRGDLESSKCKDCVASSVNQLKTACPLSVGGSIQLDGCFLKYDNKPFFGVMNTVEVTKRCGPSIGYNTDILHSRDDALVNLMAGNGKYFHGGDYGSIHVEAQCVQDLSLSDCQGCLSEASGRLRSQCETSSWGDMFLEKCYIRYYDQDIGHSSNNNSKDDGGGNNSKLIMKIIASVIGVILAISGAASLTIIIKNDNFCSTTNRVILAIPGAASVTSFKNSIKNYFNGTAREEAATSSENHKAEGAKQQEKNKKQEEEKGAKQHEKNKKQEGEKGAKQQEKNKKQEGEKGAKQQEKNKKQEEEKGAKQQEKNK